MCFSNPELGESQECCLPADEEQFYIGYNDTSTWLDGEMKLVNIPNNDQGINMIILTQNITSISFKLMYFEIVNPMDFLISRLQIMF